MLKISDEDNPRNAILYLCAFFIRWLPAAYLLASFALYIANLSNTAK